MATGPNAPAGPRDRPPAGDPREAWADAIAFQACTYLYPLWEMARMRAATAPRRDGRGRTVDADPATTRRWVNTFVHARRLLGAGASRVVTPNHDTLYTNAWLDLSRGPVVIEVPDTADRYYVLGFLDFWTNPFAHVGRRTTGTRAGTYLVTGPGWAGEVPAGMAPIPAPTAAVWIIGRILVEGPDDVPAVNALQDRFRMAPGRAARRRPPRPTTRAATRSRRATPLASSRSSTARCARTRRRAPSARCSPTSRASASTAGSRRASSACRASSRWRRSIVRCRGSTRCSTRPTIPRGFARPAAGARRCTSARPSRPTGTGAR
jgi:hypothetical protein